MGGGVNIKIPDWRQYKVDGIKELEWTRQALAAKGLKDPWLRNEVWRYQQYPGVWGNVKILFARGFKWAAGAMVITIAAKSLLQSKKPSDGHGHGHH